MVMRPRGLNKPNQSTGLWRNPCQVRSIHLIDMAECVNRYKSKPKQLVQVSATAPSAQTWGYFVT